MYCCVLQGTTRIILLLLPLIAIVMVALITTRTTIAVVVVVVVVLVAVCDYSSRIVPGSCVTFHMPGCWTFSYCPFICGRSMSSPLRIPLRPEEESAYVAKLAECIIIVLTAHRAPTSDGGI